MTNVSCYGNHVKMLTLTIHDNYGIKVLVLHIVLIILQTLDMYCITSLLFVSKYSYDVIAYPYNFRLTLHEV